jgi:hypothetical protein
MTQQGYLLGWLYADEPAPAPYLRGEALGGSSAEQMMKENRL